MKKLNIVGTLLLVLMVLILFGCTNDIPANAVNESDEINVVDAHDEATENTAKEDADETEAIQEEVSEIDVINGNLQVMYSPDTSEIIVNGAGNEIELWYDSHIIWPESEVDILALFLCHEGGNLEEKTRIAQIVVMHKNDARCPDTIKEVLCQKGMFYINTEAWNERFTPTEEDYDIAQAALASNELPEYNSYVCIALLEDMKSYYPDMDFYITEHYAFFN